MPSPAQMGMRGAGAHVAGGWATSVSDDFSSNTIGNYTFDAGGGTLSVSGGKLVPSTAAEKRFFYSVGAPAYDTVRVTSSINLGATKGIVGTGPLITRIDALNLLMGIIETGDNTIGIYKMDGGAFTRLASAAFTALTNTDYWTRLAKVGNALTLEAFGSDPISGSPSALATATHTLAGANATKYGPGISGNAGMRIFLNDVEDRYDNFRIEVPS